MQSYVLAAKLKLQLLEGNAWYFWTIFQFSEVNETAGGGGEDDSVSTLDCCLSCACIQAEEVSVPPWPQRRCRTEWWCPLVPFGDLDQTLGRYKRRPACPLLRGGLDAAPRSRSTGRRWLKQLALGNWWKDLDMCPLEPFGATWILLKYCPASNGTTL